MEKASSLNKYHYNLLLKTYARALRNNSTKAEIHLWSYVLRAKTMLGYTFNRQRPVLNYIADFMCKELMLIIEVDGYIHEFEEVRQRDIKRTKFLESVGFTILRFSNYEVLNNIEDVSKIIEEWILAKEKNNNK